METGFLLVGYSAAVKVFREIKCHVSMASIAIYIIFVGYGTMHYVKPETFAAFFFVNIFALFITKQRYAYFKYFVCIIGMFTLSLIRVEIVTTFCVPMLLRAKRDRNIADAVMGFLAVTIGVGCLVILKSKYSAGYPAGIDVVQVVFNLKKGLYVSGLFLGPALVGVCYMLKYENDWGVFLFSNTGLLISWFSICFFLYFLMGRLAEVRLIFPFSALLGFFFSYWVTSSRYRE